MNAGRKRGIITRMIRQLIGLLLAFATIAVAAQDGVSPRDSHEMRAVIEAQLEAFRQDDAERAFALATPGIRATFGTAERFIEMVRTAYPVVYRPSSVSFETPVMIEAQVVQPVRMTDAAGRAWIAFYPMQRQPDGAWRTNGCQLKRLGGLAT